MSARSHLGSALLIGTAAVSLLALVLGQQQLRQHRSRLDPTATDAELWRSYRRSLDPEQRREAALLMTGRSAGDVNRRHRLLQGQGWGSAPLAAVSLAMAAETAEQLGATQQSAQLWRDLIKRFPDQPASAWGRSRLGESEPSLQQKLLTVQPRHPAALATAAALEPDPVHGHRGALHLARWGVQWPGSAERLRAACDANGTGAPDQHQRQLLALGLAELGDGTAGLACLKQQQPAPKTALAIGRALLAGGRDQRSEGEQLLLELTQRFPMDASSDEAARLLSEPLRPDPDLLDALPPSLQERSAAVAAARVRLAAGRGGAAVLTRWPDDPASWQLQWDLAREALLGGAWADARRWLTALPDGAMPEPLEGRRLFWHGRAEQQLGNRDAATGIWRRLIDGQRSGYYRWRARVRLDEQNELDLGKSSSSVREEWAPLNSADPMVNRLWRLGLVDQAWEYWRTTTDTSKPLTKQEQLVEGRLRLAIGNTWNGLERLWRLSLRWHAPTCSQRLLLQRQQLPRPFQQEFLAASETHGVAHDLLLAISKQESRFSPGVQSVAGARGMMQLMPATAEELAGRSLSDAELNDPSLNIRFGAQYLRQLMERWQGDPMLVIASYNAGPGAVSDWQPQTLALDPELWVERIPYPETRYYTKKVLDNLLGYLERDRRFCEEGAGRIGQGRTESDS